MSSYWNNTGKYQKEFDALYARFVPPVGRASNDVGEMLRIASNLNYELFNNGGCNAYEDGEFQGDWATWLETLDTIVPSSVMRDVRRCFIKHKPPENWTEGCCMDQMIDHVYEWAVKELQSNPIVTPLEFAEAVRKYYASEHFDQRMGQYLVNTLIPSVQCPSVFYEEDGRFAMQEFCKKFVR